VRSTADESGATLPELVVAAALLLAATAMAGGTVLAPLTALGRVAVVDEDAVLLGDALDSVALLVRAARPTIDGPAILGVDHAGGTTTLRLRVTGAGGTGVATLAMADDLVLSLDGGGPPLPEGRLADGLADQSRIELLTSTGAVAHQVDMSEVVAVRVVLHRAGHDASRTVHLRLQRPLGSMRR